LHPTRLDIMFSDRFNWKLDPNALSLILQDKKSRGEAIFDLTQSNPTQAGFDYDAADILAALAQAEGQLPSTTLIGESPLTVTPSF
jgi:hypothetical protein